MPSAGPEAIIICAVRQEADAAREALRLEGLLERAPVHIAGIGKKAARCLSRLEENPPLIINFGSCGALVDEMAPGDFVLPEAILCAGGRVLECAGETIPMPVLELGEVFGYHKIWRGALATVDRGICRAEDREKCIRDLRAHAVDMEAWHLARVCREREIPFVAIKCVSDFANDQANTDFFRNIRRVMQIGAHILPVVLESCRRTGLSHE